MSQDPGKRAAGVPRRDTATRSTTNRPARPRALPKPAPDARWPFIVAGAAVLALLLAVATVGFLSLRPAGTPVPTASPEPVGAPVLPQELGEFVRDPSDVASTDPTADEGAQQVTTGRYLRNGELSIVVSAVRPATDSRAVLDSLGATAIREVGGGLCAREPSRNLDVCAATRRSTTVVVLGWRGQTLDELVGNAQQFATALG
ncbi:hypothetical protein [Naumannella cuiyingiana]|uniref:Uncharacterized protein n=1 Tax=Naumannella cuiyingiana TaxID=1347891 RepID=A0A7Z0D8Q9_9ACTN|nr:hypothetical protein [Naumannella cuiyingiana]NYI71039.1 hypothetical protein [Naumannella cuiyingiana]